MGEVLDETAETSLVCVCVLLLQDLGQNKPKAHHCFHLKHGWTHSFTLVIWDREAIGKVKMKRIPMLMNPAFCPLWSVWKWLVMSGKSRY